MENQKNNFEKLNQLVQELEDNFDNLSLSNIAVSKSTVGWHLDHCLKVIIVISKYLEDSDVNNYKKKFNFKRSLVFILRFIPRGKAKAPKIVQPSETISLADLNNQIQLVKILLNKYNYFDENKNFKHPYFGVLNLKQTIKFFEIHTNHHLKIIKDIKRV